MTGRLAQTTRLSTAATRLRMQLSKYSWLVSVGVGAPSGVDTLYVYVKYKKSLNKPVITDLVNNGFAKLPVKVEVTGPIRALKG